MYTYVCMFFKNRIAFIPPLAEAGVFCDDYDKNEAGAQYRHRSAKGSLVGHDDPLVTYKLQRNHLIPIQCIIFSAEAALAH